MSIDLKQKPIMHIDTGREWRGGQAQVWNLCRMLQDAGMAQVLVCPSGSPLAQRARESGIPLYETSLRGEFNILAARRLRRLCAERQIAIIHCHDAHAHSIARMVAGKTAPQIVVSRRVDFAISKGWLSRRKYLDSRIHYLAISNGVRDVLIEGGVDPDRIHLVPSGVDADRFDESVGSDALREEFNLAPDAPVIGTIGSLVDHKGHCYLVDAAPKIREAFSDAQFFIVGDGPLRPEIETQIARLGLDDAFYLPGFRSDLETFLKGFDVFALPSHLEGLCTSLVDAMLFRLPAVGCRTGGVPDLIIDGETGLLVESKNPDALAAAIIRLLQDSNLAKALADKAHAHAIQGFTMQSMARKTMDAYRDILHK